MAKSNKQSYENKWQEVFEGIEVRPSAQLWKNIESDLNAAENAKFKRRLVFYRFVSAAAVACMVILGIYTWSGEWGQSASSEKVTVAHHPSSNATDNTAAPEAMAKKSDEPKSSEDTENGFSSTETMPSLADETTAKEKTSSNQLQIDNRIDKVNTEAFTPPLAENQSALPGDAN